MRDACKGSANTNDGAPVGPGGTEGAGKPPRITCELSAEGEAEVLQLERGEGHFGGRDRQAQRP